jgi:ribosomal protein L10
MKYKQHKYTRQKLDINTISNSTFFMILQIKSIDIYQWINFKKQLNIYNVKIKSCSVKLLKRKSIFLTNYYLDNNVKNMYNGKTIIIYSNYEKILKIKEFFIFLKENLFFINLFTHFKSRFLYIDLFEKIINDSIETTQFKLILLLQRTVKSKNQSAALLHLKNKIK